MLLCAAATVPFAPRVTVSVLEKVYATGRKYAEGFKEAMKIVFDDVPPKWNYRAIPSDS